MNRNKESLKVIANRIADAILEERYLNKDNITALILPSLKIWLRYVEFRKTNIPEVDKLLIKIQL